MTGGFPRLTASAPAIAVSLSLRSHAVSSCVSSAARPDYQLVLPRAAAQGLRAFESKTGGLLHVTFDDQALLDSSMLPAAAASGIHAQSFTKAFEVDSMPDGGALPRTSPCTPCLRLCLLSGVPDRTRVSCATCGKQPPPWGSGRKKCNRTNCNDECTRLELGGPSLRRLCFRSKSPSDHKLRMPGPA